MTEQKPQVLVTGAGVTGGQVLRQLAASGVSARALVRSLDRAEAFKNIGTELIEGNFSQPESWRRALDGVVKVFAVTLPHPDSESWNAIFLEAAKAAGVEQIVQLSGTSVSTSSPAAFHRRMGRCDAAVKESGLGYTILQPNVFFQNLLSMAAPIRQHGRFRSAVGNARISMIDVRDIAEVAVKVLTDDGHIGKTYVLTGPESLTYFDVARLLSEATGKQIEYQALSQAEAVEALVATGVPKPIAQDRVEIHLSFSNGKFTPVTNDVASLLSHTPRSFGDFAREFATAFC